MAQTIQRIVQDSLAREFQPVFDRVGGGEVKFDDRDHVDVWTYPRGVHNGHEWELHIDVLFVDGVPTPRPCTYHCRPSAQDFFVHISDIPEGKRPQVPEGLRQMASELEARVAAMDLPRLLLDKECVVDLLRRAVVANATGGDLDGVLSEAADLLSKVDPALREEIENAAPARALH